MICLINSPKLITVHGFPYVVLQICITFTHIHLRQNEKKQIESEKNMTTFNLKHIRNIHRFSSTPVRQSTVITFRIKILSSLSYITLHAPL